MPKIKHMNRNLTEQEKARLALTSLKMLFTFGIPGGRSKVQKAIGRYLDGDYTALDKVPHIRQHFKQATELAHRAEIGVVPRATPSLNNPDAA